MKGLIARGAQGQRRRRAGDESGAAATWDGVRAALRRFYRQMCA